MRNLILGALLSAAVAMPAAASVRIDVKNELSEDCSIAVNARTDKTKWVTIGWYVFAAGEEAPIILDMVSDIRNVYIYNDCRAARTGNDTETKKVWVKSNLQFTDEQPRDRQPGYEEVVFERLQGEKYTIGQ